MIRDETAPLALHRQAPIRDAEPAQAFDDLAMLAALICGAPIALITLVDENRHWIEACVGIDPTAASCDSAFRAHTIRQDSLFVVPDALDDERFREHPLVVGEPRIRFYAGASLVTHDGRAVGTLSVIDRVPQTLTPEQRVALDALGRQALAQLGLQMNLSELARALHGRDLREAAQRRLVQRLESELASARQLGALLQFSSACEFDIVMPADPAAIRTVTEGVAEALRSRVGVFGREFEIELALQEALANAVRHGCEGDATKSVRCTVTCRETGDVRIVVRDPGRGFDLTAVPNPLEGTNPLKANGRGIFLMNQLMDEVRFVGGGREVHMRKALGASKR
jgi:anti-sigma regulatory factor (Ser/Thr protein kinase)